MIELQRFRKGYLEKFHEPRLISGYSGKVCTDACFMMLEEIPSEQHRVTIKGYNEVLNLNDIKKENDFYVDYTNNYIYFHKSKMGQTITVDDYYGIGLNFVGASRIIVRSNVSEDVIQTLEDLIEQAKLCLEAITTLGGATEVIKQLKEDTETGRQVDEQLQNTITKGNATIQSIKDTGNKSFIVNIADWVSNTNGYKYTLTHNLKSIDLHVSMIDLTDNMAYPSQYKIIDVNTIEVYAMEKIKANVVISARYFNGLGDNIGDNIVQEVADARGGMTSLGDKIRDMDKQLVTEIGNINSSLEEKTSEINVLKRKFKGEFGRNLYWADGSSGVVAESKKKEQIDACVTAGIDSVVLPIQTKYNSGNLVIVNDLDNDLKWLKYAQAQGLKVSCIKMHNYGYTSDDIASNYTNFKTQYSAIIDTVSTKFQNLNIDIFTVMNEETQYFMGMDNADNSFILDLFTTVKAKGFKAGITTAGYNYSYRVSENILSNSDVICANTYVRIGCKRERTTNLDSIKAWQEDDINDWLTYMKGKYPNAEIILSETGCMDYWAGLQTPSSFTYPDELKVTTNNQAVDIYFAGMFETMSEKVDRVWNWFNLPSVNVCKKYLSGGYANE